MHDFQSQKLTFKPKKQLSMIITGPEVKKLFYAQLN